MFKQPHYHPQGTPSSSPNGGRTRKMNMNMHVSEYEKEIIDNRVALSGLSKRDYCVQSLMYQKVVCHGNIRVTDEMKKQLAAIEQHLQALKCSADLDPNCLEKLRMILELLNGLDHIKRI